MEFRLADWEEEAIKPGNPMEKIANVTYKLRGTPELVRLRSGFLIKDILERTAKKIQGTLHPENQTLYMYSAHSSTLATMLNGFGLNEVVVIKNNSIDLFLNSFICYQDLKLYFFLSS